MRAAAWQTPEAEWPLGQNAEAEEFYSSRHRAMPEIVRFLFVSSAGLLLDLAIAWGAARFFGAPLSLAAAIGFIVAAVLNYSLHELWTFRDGERRLSASRASRYAAALAVTLATRVATVALVARIVGEEKVLSVIVVGAGVSVGVNFLISKWLVFRSCLGEKDLGL